MTLTGIVCLKAGRCEACGVTRETAPQGAMRGAARMVAYRQTAGMAAGCLICLVSSTQWQVFSFDTRAVYLL